MRMPLVQSDTASEKAALLLDKTQAQLGRVPNLYRAMANAPAALEGYLAFRGALVGGVLDNKMRERLALLVAEINGCEYCVSAHVFRGGKIGLTEAELTDTRYGRSDDPKINAALEFASAVMMHKGNVSALELNDARAAGVTDEELTEIVAHIALNVFSNYFNHVARPELDFPAVAVHEAVA